MPYLIDDNTFVAPAVSGYVKRTNRHTDGFSAPYSLDTIPEAEWADRISDQDKHKSSLHHLWQDSKIGVLNQNPLLYCHSFAGVMAMQLCRERQGLPYLELSASSVAGPVTGFQNRGAWIGNVLKVMADRGASTTEFVPMRQVSKSGWKPGAEENAKLHRATEWLDLGRRNFGQVATCLLNNIPVVVGLNWWSHAITYLRLIWHNGKPAVLFLNSWGTSYGDGGLGILQGSKMVPDEAWGLTQVTASVE